MSVLSDLPPHRAGFGASPDDYDQVAAAVMESARGRWFLEEFARRNRAAETERVLGALSEMEQRLAAGDRAPANGAVEAAALIERAATRGALLRRVLAEISGGNRQLVRALRLSAEVEHALAAALKALGVPATEPRAQEIGAQTTPPPAASAEIEPEDDKDEATPAAEPELEPIAVDLADAPPAQAAEPVAAEPPPAGAATEAAEISPPELKPAKPGGLPPAWTPGLLETMSEEDRAKLFA